MNTNWKSVLFVFCASFILERMFPGGALLFFFSAAMLLGAMRAMGVFKKSRWTSNSQDDIYQQALNFELSGDLDAAISQQFSRDSYRRRN